tara:strand:+ start:1621 stop:1821 length:201 start_codon:yes stop_codon:yes gene_type:complete
MRSFYLYRGFDRAPVLDTVYSMGEAKRQAVHLSKQLGVITVRDALGGLRLEVNPDAPETHKVRVTK